MGEPAHRRTADLWLVAGGLALTAVSVWLSGSSVAGRVDREVFTRINSLPDMLYRPLWVSQLTGVLGAPVVVAVVALGARKFRLATAPVLLVPAKLIVERAILKALVNRERPGASIPGAVLRDVPAAGLAFPLGHAVILFGMVALLSPYLSRRWRVVILVIAVVAAAVRVYLGGAFAARCDRRGRGRSRRGCPAESPCRCSVPRGSGRPGFGMRIQGGTSSLSPEPKSPSPGSMPVGPFRR